MITMVDFSDLRKGALMDRTCRQCGAVIPPQQGPQRPRSYCVDCRPSKNRTNPRIITLPAREEPAINPTRLVESYRAVLEAAGRLDTPQGAHVAHLAQLFATGPHTAAGAASLSRELRAALDSALAGVPPTADALDELAARRQTKMSGA